VTRAAAAIAVLAACALAAPEAHAGAWTRGFGEHYLRVGFEHYQASRYEDAQGPARGGTEYVARGLHLYGEVGVLPAHPLQLSVSLPVAAGTLEFPVERAVDGAPGRASTVRAGDLRAAVQTAVLSGDLQLAVALELKLPLYANDGVGGDHPGYEDVFPLPGDGQIDLAPWLLAGRSLGPAFVEAAVGWVWRTEAFLGYTTDARFSDGFAWRAKGGVGFGPLLGLLELDGMVAAPLNEHTREWIRLAPQVALTLWEGLALDLRGGIDLWSRNAPQGFAVGAGLSWRSPR
jgi:hypothetical protein